MAAGLLHAQTVAVRCAHAEAHADRRGHVGAGRSRAGRAGGNQEGRHDRAGDHHDQAEDHHDRAADHRDHAVGRHGQEAGGSPSDGHEGRVQSHGAAEVGRRTSDGCLCPWGDGLDSPWTDVQGVEDPAGESGTVMGHHVVAGEHYVVQKILHPGIDHVGVVVNLVDLMEEVDWMEGRRFLNGCLDRD